MIHDRCTHDLTSVGPTECRAVNKVNSLRWSRARRSRGRAQQEQHHSASAQQSATAHDKLFASRRRALTHDRPRCWSSAHASAASRLHHRAGVHRPRPQSQSSPLTRNSFSGLSGQLHGPRSGAAFVLLCTPSRAGARCSARRRPRPARRRSAAWPRVRPIFLRLRCAVTQMYDTHATSLHECRTMR